MAATMHVSFRDQWRELRRSRPGHRFQDRYARARQEDMECGPGQRIALIAIAFVALLVGAFFAVFPGPAIPFFFIGGGLLASESRVIARFMDWAEVKVRDIIAWARRKWRRLPTVGRVLVLLLGAGGSAMATYWGLQFLQR
jgi:hypothetical protein